MKGPLALLPVALSMTLVASVAGAEPDGYVQGGLMVTSQPAGTANHRVSPPISGQAVGLAAAVGFRVAPRVAIEGEVVTSGTISTPQHFHYNWFEDFTGESRNVFVGVNVRWQPAALVEVVGGGGLAFGTFAERSIVRTELPFPGRPNVPTSDPDRVDTGVQIAANGGIALPLPVSRSIAVVPEFRLRFTAGSNGQADYLGVGSYAYQFGATVRFMFD